MRLQRAGVDGYEVVCEDDDDCAEPEGVGEVVERLVGYHCYAWFICFWIPSGLIRLVLLSRRTKGIVVNARFMDG